MCFFWLFLLGNEARPNEIDSEISQIERNLDKISMTKNDLTVESKLPLPLKKNMLSRQIWPTFGKNTVTLVNSLATFPRRRTICLKIAFFLHKSSLMFYTRTIRNYTIATTTYWDKLISVSTVLKIWLATFARRMRLRSIGLGITPSEVNS